MRQELGSESDLIRIYVHLTGSEGAVRQAVKLDPLSAAVCTLGDIDKMVTEMLEDQARWLPQFRAVSR